MLRPPLSCKRYDTSDVGAISLALRVRVTHPCFGRIGSGRVQAPAADFMWGLMPPTPPSYLRTDATPSPYVQEI